MVSGALMIQLVDFVLELTDRCPLQCVHCSSNSSPKRTSHLTRAVVDRLVGEAMALGARKISFGGGEPTISPMLQDVLRDVDQRGMQAEVFTSGVGDTRQPVDTFSDRFIRRLAELGQLKLVFSIHGCTANVHDHVTGVNGSYDAMLDSLRRCLAAGIRCEGNFVPLKLNARSFGAVTKFAFEHGIRKLSVLRFVPQGRGLMNREQIELDGNEEVSFVQQLLVLRSNSPVTIRTGSPYNGIVPGNRVPCRAGSRKLVVQADGNVLPCEVYKHHRERDWGLSVYHESVESILSSSQLSSFRSQCQNGDCLQCPVHGQLREEEPSGPRNVFEQISRTAVRV